MISARKATLVLSAMAALAWAQPALAGEARPFKMTGTGVIEGNPFVGAPMSASGVATHLGAWTHTGFLTFYDDGGQVIGEGYVTFVAADGDTLAVSRSTWIVPA